MHTFGIFEAKTHLSRIIDDLVSGKEDRVMISKHGKPAVIVTPAIPKNTSERIGIARGKFAIPDDIDTSNDRIADMFAEQTHK